jgi:hypothetical protein
MIGSPARDRFARRHLGLPAEVPSTSLLTWDAIAQVHAALRLSPERTLLDLACGRGGYGLRWPAAARGWRESTSRERPYGRPGNRHGGWAGRRVSRSRTWWPRVWDAASVDAVMCIDSVQFAQPQQAAYDEIHRVLVPGGRVVLTCWENRPTGDALRSFHDEGVRVLESEGLFRRVMASAG